MLHPLETLEPNEAALIAEMTDILRRKMERDYAQGATKRDAHPKALGVLRGTFSVQPDLPAALKVGVFKEAASHACWVRVSNASGTPQSDAVKDFRGIAIKLMTPGKDAEAPMGQDFVLMNFPTMPLGTIRLFRDAVYFSIERSPLLLVLKMLLTGKGAALKALKQGRTNPSSPLDLRYWSTTPYVWGADQVVKYSLIPTSAQRSSLPAALGDSYLSEAMQTHLASHPASFDFCVQLRKGNMPVEDAGVEWDEAVSPFVKVASLQLEKQMFLGSKERDELAEALSFSPGHARPEHTPLGGINRARVAIYNALSKFRHERDGRENIA
jgi:Catalase